jgi:hypothetical protein
MFDFWCIPYLLGQGLSRTQILSFLKAAQKLLLADLDARPVDASDALSSLRPVFQRSEVA